MKIKMTKSVSGAANDAGSKSMLYAAGKTYIMDQPWQQDLAVVFLDNDWAEELVAKAVQPAVENKDLGSAPEDKEPDAPPQGATTEDKARSKLGLRGIQ